MPRYYKGAGYWRRIQVKAEQLKRRCQTHLWSVVTNTARDKKKPLEHFFDALLLPWRLIMRRAPFLLLKAEQQTIETDDISAYKGWDGYTAVRLSQKRLPKWSVLLGVVLMPIALISLLLIGPLKALCVRQGWLGINYARWHNAPIPHLLDLIKAPERYIKPFSARSLRGADTQTQLYQNEDGAFLECGCMMGRDLTNLRARQEDKILDFAQSQLCPDDTMRYMGFGSGSLLQDYIIICKLIAAGFNKLDLVMVDNNYPPEDMTDVIHSDAGVHIIIFRLLMRYFNSLPGINIQLSFYALIEDVPADWTPDIISAVDIDNYNKISSEFRQLQQSLSASGSLFLSFFNQSITVKSDSVHYSYVPCQEAYHTHLSASEREDKLDHDHMQSSVIDFIEETFQGTLTLGFDWADVVSEAESDVLSLFDVGAPPIVTAKAATTKAPGAPPENPKKLTLVT